MKKIVDPKIGKYLEEKVLTLKNSRGDCYDLLVQDCEIDFSIQEVEFNGCRFEKVDFSKGKIKYVDFIDCIFKNCNLAGVDFSNRSIHRCSFEHCNLVGCDFIESGIQDVRIIDSKCDYINFSSSNIKHFLIQDSVFRKGRLVDIEWESIWFEKVDFKETEFLNTKLKGIDFSYCQIEDIAVLAKDVKGMIVNSEQALLLVSLLGVEIKN